MAKTASKSPAKTAAKKTAAAPKAKPAAGSNIEKVCEETWKTLKAIGVDKPLQNDIEWCLGSYRADGNPTGLYEMAERALTVLNSEKAKKTKGVTAKVVGDLEKALKSR